MEKALPISSKTWHHALVAAGVISNEDKVRRIVIDAKLDGVVVVHVERVGDERLLDVIPTLDGIRITETAVSA